MKIIREFGLVFVIIFAISCIIRLLSGGISIVQAIMNIVIALGIAVFGTLLLRAMRK